MMHNLVKYSNRKLYSLKLKREVNLTEILEMVKNNERINVVDKTTRKDVTTNVLSSIVANTLNTTQNKLEEFIKNA